MATQGESGAGGRGVTRHHAGGHAPPGSEERARHEEKHHAATLWIPWTLVLLGVWTMLAPVTFGYDTGVVEPSGGREVWLSLPARVAATQWNDVACGAALTLLGWRALTPHRPVSLWLACGVGIWLSLAPVVLWAPTAVAYANDTLVGMLVIALTVLIPGMPHMSMFMKRGGSVPPGWSYNPSSWPQRAIMIALGLAGFLTSRYLAAYQLGYAPDVWDPFFGDQSRRVLDSRMSHMWPVSDAALGTFAYTFEMLMGFMGGPARWRTMPWMVTFYGILVIPLGLVHIALVISQPVVVGAWCTFCLLAAAIMLPMIPLEGDEVIAMGQHLLRARRRGESVWRVFWKGGDPEGAEEDERTPELANVPERPGAIGRASLWGMSTPWSLVACAAVGIASMAAPATLGMGATASTVFQLGGALVVTFAVIAMGEVFRAARVVAALLGLAIAIAPWLVAGAGTGARVAGLVLGLAAALLSIPRGPKREHYGGWDRAVI